MPEISIEIVNDEFWVQELSGLHQDILTNIKDQVRRCAYLVGAHFRVYPPKPGGSTYIRTGELADSVKLTDTPSGTKLSIDPISPRGVHYGTYVIGDANGQNQAWMHKGRWSLLKAIADKESESMFRGAEAQLAADIRERGLS